MRTNLSSALWSILLFALLPACAAPVYKNDVSSEASSRRKLECPAQAYDNQPVVVWKAFPIAMYFDNSIPEGAISAITNAGERWNKAVGITLFKFKRLTSSKSSQGSINVIYWNHGSPPEKENMVAFTKTLWSNPYLLKADIFIFSKNNNVSFGVPKNSYDPDLEAVMVHEFGHVFGLEHTKTGVMSEESDLSINEREIDSVAASSVRCLYKENLSPLPKLYESAGN